jgi:branched-chain amino acid transport system substrate-binding protein
MSGATRDGIKMRQGGSGFMKNSTMGCRLLVGVAAAAMLTATAASAQTVKIGLILSYTGFLAQAGASIDQAVALYVKTHAADLPPGVKIEIVRRDDTSDAPDVGKRLAQELITREHVQLLAGLVSSPIAAAIAPLTAEAKMPFVIMNAGGVAIPRISPYVVRFSFTLWETGYPMGQWAAKQGWKKGYTATSDYIPGHDAEEAFTKGFTDGGGAMVGLVRFPPAGTDFAPYIQRIKDAKPDTLFIFLPGGKQTTQFMKTWTDAGMASSGIKIVATHDLVTDDELPNMGEAPLGIVSAGNYSVAAKRPQNEAFLAAWRAEYKDKFIPNYMSVAGWDAMNAIYALVKETKGKFDGDQAMTFFKAYKDADSPRGPIEIDPKTRDLIQNIYIRKVEKVNGHLANVEFETIPMVKDPWKEFNPPK